MGTREGNRANVAFFSTVLRNQSAQPICHQSKSRATYRPATQYRVVSYRVARVKPKLMSLAALAALAACGIDAYNSTLSDMGERDARLSYCTTPQAQYYFNIQDKDVLFVLLYLYSSYPRS